jgi:hypothetical protein
MTKDFEHKTFTQPPEAESLVKYLRKNFPGGDYKTVYEAGFSGYSAHEKSVEQGVCSMVVSPAEVPTRGSEKVRKTNPVDARKLARSLSETASGDRGDSRSVAVFRSFPTSRI